MEQYSQAAVGTESNLFELQIDHENMRYLGETAKWAKFLSIVGFVMCGLLVIAALFAGSLLSSFSPLGGTMGASGLLVTIIYIGGALLYFFPCLYMFNFARKMQMAMNNNDQSTLNASFSNLKSSFKFVGILTIVILSIYLLLILIALIVGLSR
ncbi:hypothetical protein FAM09_15455 [Niastella caeni]|uniref:DUF5362 domain-containing protein n=1 Tax=Niastella caeni TaxID=2569763 RepID=A0A4S8HRL3_9BACT|nr:DUF5362 family protein [Niastella caeni]THU38080.1 hypothetical protein FAM09_15455 [Niastella caeni]